MDACWVSKVASRLSEMISLLSWLPLCWRSWVRKGSQRAYNFLDDSPAFSNFSQRSFALCLPFCRWKWISPENPFLPLHIKAVQFSVVSLVLPFPLSPIVWILVTSYSLALPAVGRKAGNREFSQTTVFLTRSFQKYPSKKRNQCSNSLRDEQLRVLM